MVTIATIKLFERGLADLTARVNKLNKRAARHNMVPLSLSVLSTATVERKLPGGTVVPVVQHSVEITGCEPCIDGWRLAAKIEFNDIIGNVVRIAPGRDDDGSYVSYRTIGAVCEHCNTKRRRNDVFVLEDANGCRKIVARNCLADYLRCGDADSLARWAEFADELRCEDGDGEKDCDDWDGERREYGHTAMSIGAYLRIVAMVKRRFGWLGRTAARDSFDGTATADYAARIIYGRGSYHDKWMIENELTVDDKDGDYADKAVVWAAGLDDAGCSEYIHIIGKIARVGTVDLRTLDGYAASILVAYDKAMEREIEYANRNAKKRPAVFFGCSKKREKGVRVTCKGLNSFDGFYGVTTLVRFEHYPNDTERAVLTWFASKDCYNDWDVDAEYVISFTCKDHEDHERFGKQTRINRVKVCA